MKVLPTKSELRVLARSRYREARVLLAADEYEGSIYLVGYAIEFGLKVRICSLLSLDTYPAHIAGYKTHDLPDLVKLAGWEKRFAKESSQSSEFKTNWSVVTAWDPQWRYQETADPATRAREILNAVGDENHGIFTWIRKRW